MLFWSGLFFFPLEVGAEGEGGKGLLFSNNILFGGGGCYVTVANFFFNYLLNFC